MHRSTIKPYFHLNLPGSTQNLLLSKIWCRLCLTIQTWSRLELYEKSQPKLQFVYSKRKVSTKLFYAPKQDEFFFYVDQSMRQPIRDHCTLRESSHHCPHHFPTRIPMLLPYLRWATVRSGRNKCVSDLLNSIPKERIKVRKTPIYLPYNSIMLNK